MRLSICLLALMSEMKTLSIVPLNRTIQCGNCNAEWHSCKMAIGGLSKVAKLLLINSTKVQNPRRNS